MAPSRSISASRQSIIRAAPQLPNEVFLMIIQNCPGVTLKQLRLVSKTLAQMTDPFLWRTVVLVPNDHCVLAFIKTLKRSKVLRHVTNVVYDGRFGSFFPEMKKLVANQGPPSTPAARSKDLQSLDRTFQGDFKPYEDMSIEIACVAKALRLLPNLKQACVREYDDDAFNFTHPASSKSVANIKVPFFYLKICKDLGVSPETVNWVNIPAAAGRSYIKGFITAAFSADCRLHKLKTTGVDARAMFGAAPLKSAVAYQQFSIFKNIMDGLRDLHLSFRNDTLTSTANHIEALGLLLKSARKLTTLRLRLTDCSTCRYQYSDEELMSDLGPLVETTNGTWMSKALIPKLENLIIDACICHDEDLLHFLKIHSATLRRLELSNVTLLGGEDRRECWVRLIKHLRSDLRLDSISFSGWFSNGGRQQWSVAKDTVANERLKARVESYVVDRRLRDCPLEPVAIRPNEGDVVKPSNGEEFEGDLTWTMVYSSRFTDPGDWIPTAPSFGITTDTVPDLSSHPYELTPPPQSEPGSLGALDHTDMTESIAPQSVLDLEMTVEVQNATAGDLSWTLGTPSPSPFTQAPGPPGFETAPVESFLWGPPSPSLTAC